MANLELITEYKPIKPKVGDKFRVVKNLHGGGVGDVITCTEADAHARWESYPKGSVDFQNTTGEGYVGIVYAEKLTTEYLEPVESEEPKGRWLGKGMLEETESAQLWVNAIKEQAEHHHMGTPFRSCMMGDWIEKPIKKTLIQKSMSFIKRLTQSADDKTLEKAGFTNSCGDLTSRGEDALMSLVFAEKKAALVKLAEEVIAEDKE